MEAKTERNTLLQIKQRSPCKSSKRASLTLSPFPVKITQFSLCSNVPWLSLVPPDWWGKSNADTFIHWPGPESIKKKLEQNGFPHSGLWAGDLSQFKRRPKKTINSTLKFSISRRVKLWDNCHDLINKRNGSNSWPCTGERQLKMIMWINADSTITEPSELSTAL